MRIFFPLGLRAVATRHVSYQKMHPQNLEATNPRIFIEKRRPVILIWPFLVIIVQYIDIFRGHI